MNIGEFTEEILLAFRARDEGKLQELFWAQGRQGWVEDIAEQISVVMFWQNTTAVEVHTNWPTQETEGWDVDGRVFAGLRLGELGFKVEHKTHDPAGHLYTKEHYLLVSIPGYEETPYRHDHEEPPPTLQEAKRLVREFMDKLK